MPLFKNYFIENTYTNKEVFRLYSFFIDSMSQNEYLIVGESTNFVPLVSKLEKYEVELNKLSRDPVSEEVIETSYDVQITEDSKENTDDVLTIDADSETADELQEVDAEVIEETPADADIDEVDDAESEETVSSIFVDDDEPEPADMDEPEGLDIEEDEETETTEPLECADTTVEPEEDTNSVSLKEEGFTNVYKEDFPADTVDDTAEREVEEVIPEVEVEIPSDLAEDMEPSEPEISLPDENFDSNEVNDEPEQPLTPEIIPLENRDDEIGEFEEIDVSDIDDADILVDMEEETQLSVSSDDYATEVYEDQIDKDITEDVDRVFSTIKDEGISDSDLDLIDALNGNETDEINPESDDDTMFSDNDMEILQELDSDEEEEFTEPLEEISDSDKPEPEKEILEKRESSTPMVPIYDAGIPEEDRVVSDEIEQGDTVMHAKYGSGVVEKMIKYGNKNLYSINFENVGRRLLDPTLISRNNREVKISLPWGRCQ